MDRLTRLALEARDEPNRIEPFVREAQVEVWRLCAALVGREHADDVAQDSLIRILRALPAFRNESSARTWALRITRYTCADWIRSRQRQRRLVDDVAALLPPQTSRSDGGRVELDLLVDHLPDEFREAFVLTQVLGTSYAEAAEVCGCRVGTIRSRVSRAREQLVSWIEPESVTDADHDGRARPG